MERKGGGKRMKESAVEENSSRKERREVEGEKITGRKGSLEEGKIKERSVGFLSGIFSPDRDDF
jgi:hypothetical protein